MCYCAQLLEPLRRVGKRRLNPPERILPSSVVGELFISDTNKRKGPAGAVQF